jgi:hypothetical protein
MSTVTAGAWRPVRTSGAERLLGKPGNVRAAAPRRSGVTRRARRRASRARVRRCPRGSWSGGLASEVGSSGRESAHVLVGVVLGERLTEHGQEVASGRGEVLYTSSAVRPQADMAIHATRHWADVAALRLGVMSDYSAGWARVSCVAARPHHRLEFLAVQRGTAHTETRAGSRVGERVAKGSEDVFT